MREWLMSLCAGAVIFMLLEFLIKGAGMKDAARFAFGILFMAMLLMPLVEIIIGRAVWVH